MSGSPAQEPGVYWEGEPAARASEPRDGVPVFLGLTQDKPAGPPGPARPRELARWSQFAELFPSPPPDGYLAPAVRGFFENGGNWCYVLGLGGPELSPGA